jgi:hypothetical protein
MTSIVPAFSFSIADIFMISLSRRGQGYVKLKPLVPHAERIYDWLRAPPVFANMFVFL